VTRNGELSIIMCMDSIEDACVLSIGTKIDDLG